ncbi:serine/threonine protein kinase, CMGC group [Serendipita sp. 400]|nr:serine/threonine protein kinase, CMGC group [Serendipita sp. 400]
MSSYKSTGQTTSELDEEEDWEDYVPGGYHPVHIGDEFSDGRYVVVRKLGWGHFSTVWLARDKKMNRHVALKVVKSAARYTETALDEIKLLQRLISSDPTHPGRSHVISFLDHFRHKGPNGNHVCMVFEVLGENLLGLIKRHQTKGVPIGLVRQISKQILLGLDYMHRACGVIHTDLKPENVLICIDNVEEVIRNELAQSAATKTKLIGVPPSKGRGGNQTPRAETIYITGSRPLPSPTTWTDHHFTDDIQTRQYRCPEVILGAPWGTTADIWSSACLFFELMTGGDYLFDPASGARYSKDDDHIAQIIELMGEFPKSVAFAGKYSGEFFNRKGELRHIHKLRFWPMEDVLHDKYLLSKEESRMLASFLNSMLHLHPQQRASADQMLKHPLISELVVQGEVDQIIRAEQEAKRSSGEGVTSPVDDPSGEPSAAMEVDAEAINSTVKNETGVSGGGGGGGGGKKKKKNKKRANAALANADADAIEQAEATVAQRAVDDANAMKPIEILDDEEESTSRPPASRSQVNVRDRTSSAQRAGST